MAAPGTVTSGVRNWLMPISARFCSVRPSPESATLDDGNGGGGVVQDQGRRGAGRHLLQQGLRDRGDLALAVRISTFGWKKILMIPKPL